jgi:hypothetical protein
LHKLRPVLIVSGDDHDQCLFVHNQFSVEYTLGTFSWLQGNWIPSFGIIDNDGYRVCFLPCQYTIFFMYAGIFLFCLLIVIITKLMSFREQRMRDNAISKKRRSEFPGDVDGPSNNYFTIRFRKKNFIIRYLVRIMILGVLFFVFLSFWDR